MYNGIGEAFFSKITDANINTTISYNKLWLAGSIVNNDISSTAAINPTKLLLPNNTISYLRGDGTFSKVQGGLQAS